MRLALVFVNSDRFELKKTWIEIAQIEPNCAERVKKPFVLDFIIFQLRFFLHFVESRI